MSKATPAALLLIFVILVAFQLNPYLRSHSKVNRLSPLHLIIILSITTLFAFAMWNISASKHISLPGLANAPSNTTTSDDEGSQVHTNTPATPAPVTTATGCDQSLWSHVYHPSRLTILDNCKTVTGTIDVVRIEADGDDHILLRLDAPYTNLINSKNTQDEHGDLVLEPVCEHTATQSDATSACQNYTSPVTVPPSETHVTVTGSYVLDTDHGWNEIHPVTSITY